MLIYHYHSLQGLHWKILNPHVAHRANDQQVIIILCLTWQNEWGSKDRRYVKENGKFPKDTPSIPLDQWLTWVECYYQIWMGSLPSLYLLLPEVVIEALMATKLNCARFQGWIWGTLWKASSYIYTHHDYTEVSVIIMCHILICSLIRPAGSICRNIKKGHEYIKMKQGYLSNVINIS